MQNSNKMKRLNLLTILVIALMPFMLWKGIIYENIGQLIFIFGPYVFLFASGLMLFEFRSKVFDSVVFVFLFAVALESGRIMYASTHYYELTGTHSGSFSSGISLVVLILAEYVMFFSFSLVLAIAATIKGWRN